MSADNGVYIVRFLVSASIGLFEWRVAEMQNVEDLNHPEIGEFFRVVTFGNKVTFCTSQLAAEEARRIYSSLDICEYGIQTLHFDKPLLAMTVTEAKMKLDDWYGKIRKKTKNSSKTPVADDRIQVNLNHKFHAGRIGYFRFWACPFASSEFDVAVISVTPATASSSHLGEDLFAVAKNDFVVLE